LCSPSSPLLLFLLSAPVWSVRPCLAPSSQGLRQVSGVVCSFLHPLSCAFAWQSRPLLSTQAPTYSQLGSIHQQRRASPARSTRC
ncbi:uncharacterized protein B0I36DRAFT_419991, partial [Microdochium trichocladiopsis]